MWPDLRPSATDIGCCPLSPFLRASTRRVAEREVERLVKTPLSQGEFDALVDFVFNLGAGRLAGSTLLKELNAGRYEAVAAELLRWDHAGGVENVGLRARREAELALWRGETAE